MKIFLHGIAALSGLIIGVGIFGVPYVFVQAGWFSGLFWLVVLGILSILVHLFYGEVVAETPGLHRLAGYSRALLGTGSKRIVIALDVMRFWGLQIAYIIGGGIFLTLLLGPILGGSILVYSSLIFLFVAIITFFGLRLVDKVEFYLSWILIAALLIISGKGISSVDISNFAGLGGNFFAPYGVIMIALAGTAAIPQLWDIVGRNRIVFKASIIVGTLIPILITGLFALVVAGVSGSETSPEAIEGLRGFLGNAVVLLGAFIGFVAIITSYLIVALYVKEALEYDVLLKRIPAWLAAVVVPFVVFFAGARDFIHVIDLIGSVLIGGGRIFIVALAIIIFTRKKLGWWRAKLALGILIIGLLTVGVIQELAGLI